MARRRWTSALYEFLRFGVKQAWACLFGGIVVVLLIAHLVVLSGGARAGALRLPVPRRLAVQAALLAARLETSEEAKVILIYHLVGTVMEIFKTAVGSWIYPEPGFFRIGGVPLFTGFMYACIGSYLCRAWRLFDFRFTHHPPRWALVALSVAIYVNFFTHHYVVRPAPGCCSPRQRCAVRPHAVYFMIWRPRWMPLLLGFCWYPRFIWSRRTSAP